MRVLLTTIVITVLSATAASAECGAQKSELFEQLRAIESDVLSNNQKMARLQAETDQLFFRLSQARGRHSQLSAMLAAVRNEQFMLQQQQQALQGEANFLAPFGDPWSMNRKYMLSNALQQIELRLLEIQIGSNDAFADLNGIGDVVAVLSADFERNRNALTGLMEESRRLFSQDRELANRLVYFQTPEGRQACSQAELNDVQARLASAKADLDRVAQIRDEHERLRQRQADLNAELKGFLQEIKTSG